MSPPVVVAQMLIRKAAQEVFDAFIDPDTTTQFWFTKSSGSVEPGATLLWEWEMYGGSAEVEVYEVEANSRIRIQWGDPPCPVEWSFEPRGEAATLVRITTSGFAGTDDEIVAKAIDSMGGFTSLLAALKAFLEHGIRLNLVADHNPDAHITSWQARPS